MKDFFSWLLLSWWIDDSEKNRFEDENVRLQEDLGENNSENDYDQSYEDQEDNYEGYEDFGINDYPEDY